MSAVRTTLVTRSHAYTGEDVPWRMDAVNDLPGALSPFSGRSNRRLFHYLSGCGVSGVRRGGGFGALSRRRRRFLRIAAALFAAWVVFWFV